MSYEGNYIDGLMSRKESIYTLLRAKYILYSIAILIPLILMIPAMATGKLSVLSCIAWATFVAGAFTSACSNWLYTTTNSGFKRQDDQPPEYGNRIAELDFRSSIRRASAYELCADNFWGPTVTAWILIAVGAGFILTSRFWLKNVYHRFMKRRYKNMEGFRDSRQ